MREITDNIIDIGGKISIRGSNLTASELYQVVENSDKDNQEVLKDISESRNISLFTLNNALILYGEPDDDDYQASISKFG